LRLQIGSSIEFAKRIRMGDLLEARIRR